MIIKKHPRDTRTLFEDMGTKVFRSSFIPWEAVALMQDFSNSVFLTLYSTSIINAAVLGAVKTKCIYMYPLVHGISENLDKTVLDKIRIKETFDYFNNSGIVLKCIVVESDNEIRLAFNNL